MTAILKNGIKVLLTGLVVFGVFAAAASAQPKETKKIAFKIDKSKIAFRTGTLDLPAGKIIVSGVVKGVEVSGGKGGCYTLTVTTYRLTPSGEKVPVRSRSKKVCLLDRLPELVIDLIPKGRYVVEVEIDRPLIDRKKLQGELVVTIQPERINLR